MTIIFCTDLGGMTGPEGHTAVQQSKLSSIVCRLDRHYGFLFPSVTYFRPSSNVFRRDGRCQEEFA